MEADMVTHNGGHSNVRFASPFAHALRYAVTATAILALASTPLMGADRTPLKPGWNMFSPQQDVEVGQQAAREAEQQLQLLNDARVDQYLNNLGRSLAAYAPGERFSYQFKCVNDRAINAFALPGGFVYVNRGAIEAADNEAQLAGVMAHETSHVALRHGTNQATKASVAQAPLGILGGMLGGNSATAMLAQLGAGFAAKSILLKYSRTDESQADIMGTQILYDSGYDPRAMAQFFEKIQAESKGGQLEFFSDHPNPDHRIERVDEEIRNLGGARPGSKTDSPEFQQIKRSLLGRPAPAGKGTGKQLSANTSNTQVRSGSDGLQILTASYGAKERFADVRQLLQSRVQNNRLNLQVTNASMGGDPIQGEVKTLRVSYALAGRTYEAVTEENQSISIPTEQQLKEMEAAMRSSTSGLQILTASYGAKEKFADVRQLLQSRVQNDRLSLQVTNASMGGDPIEGEVKTLRVSYAWAGRTYEITVAENQSIFVPSDQQLKAKATAAQSNLPIDRPSNRWKTFENSVLYIEYPDNWQVYGQGDAVTIAPRGGLVDDRNGNKALAYGVIVNIYEPHSDRQERRQLQTEHYGESSRMSLEEGTDRLIQGFQESNRNMRVVRRAEDIRVGSQRGLSIYLSNDSPLGDRETNWLVTLQRSEGLLFLILTAPDRDFPDYQRTFQQLVKSIRLR
jgi:predicted Zn-dependent protease